jgi:Protein of unknown function (DUF2806)
MRREGRASIDLKGEELLMLAQVERDADKIRRGEASIVLRNHIPMLLAEDKTSVPQLPDAGSSIQSIVGLSEMANNALVAETIRREVNVTKALLHAEEALETDPQEVPESAVGDDWLYRWRDSASEVSADELQFLWGRLLAGEVKAPGSYSLRTLEFLRNLSQHEAESIAKLSPFVISGFVYKGAQEFLQNEGITFRFLLEMQQLGVLSGVDAVGLSATLGSNSSVEFVNVITSNSIALMLTADDPKQEFTIPIYQLTIIGQQILQLGKFEPHIEYLKKVGEHFKAQGAKVLLGSYLGTAPGRIKFVEQQIL